MKKLEYLECEIEYLKQFGIELKYGKFVNCETGNEFEIKSQSEEVDYGPTISLYYKFNCIEDDLDIEFFRTEKESFFKESSHNVFIVGVNKGNKKYYMAQNFNTDSKKIVFGIESNFHSKYDTKKPYELFFRYGDICDSYIDINHDYSSEYLSKATLVINSSRNSRQESGIVCSLSSIFEDAIHEYRYPRGEREKSIEDVTHYSKKMKLNVENYKEALIDMITRLCENDADSMRFYLSMVDIMAEAFESQLGRTYSNKEEYIKRLNERREKIDFLLYGDERKQKLAEVDEMFESLQNDFPQFDVNKTGLRKTKQNNNS